MSILNPERQPINQGPARRSIPALNSPSEAQEEPWELRGKTPPWGTLQIALLVVLIAAGLSLRLLELSAEGFADDEVHKWLAANRYLAGNITGDDVEHPMLMKDLIALSLLVGRRLGSAPETITRLPNALAGGVSIWVVALLGRRLFGNAAALWGAALAAVSSTFIGYQRIAKEDTLLGLFLMLLCWCAAEAKAAADDGRNRDRGRWELWGTAALAGMLASKYFFHLAVVPLVFYVSVRGTGTAWVVRPRRWFELVGIAFLIWAGLNWTPFLPSTWAYAASYIPGGQTVHGSLFFMGRIYHNLTEYGLKGTPPWFYLVFLVVKLAPLTLCFALLGFAIALWKRRPAHRLVLSWIGVWFAIHSTSGSKWGRFFVAVMPAFLLLAGHATALLLVRTREAARLRVSPPFTNLFAGAFGLLLAVLLPGGEARAALAQAPHYRLYVSPLFGGERNVSWFLPLCDYYDAGFRESVQYTAARAEPGAEFCTEIDWVSRLYAGWSGRSDLLHTLLRPAKACRSQRACYVFVQTGRQNFHDENAVQSLSGRAPWHVIQIRGQDVVKVYRLDPGESPFPAASDR